MRGTLRAPCGPPGSSAGATIFRHPSDPDVEGPTDLAPPVSHRATPCAPSSTCCRRRTGPRSCRRRCCARRSTSMSWNMITKGEVCWCSRWSSSYSCARLAGSRSSTAAAVLRGHLRDVPGVAPGELAGIRRAVGVVRVGGEGVGVGVRVLVVRAPAADVDVVGARAVLGQRLLVVARQDLERDPGLGPVGLQHLRDLRQGRGVAGVHRDREAVLEAGLLQQLLGLRRRSSV